jgi:hypothetical protein
MQHKISCNKALQHRSASLHWTGFKSHFVVLLRKSIPQTATLNLPLNLTLGFRFTRFLQF